MPDETAIVNAVDEYVNDTHVNYGKLTFVNMTKQYLVAFPSPLMHATHQVMAERGDLIANKYVRLANLKGEPIEQACLYGSIYGFRNTFNGPRYPFRGDMAIAANMDNNWTEAVRQVRLSLGDLSFDNNEERFAIDGAIGKVLLPRLQTAAGVANERHS